MTVEQIFEAYRDLGFQSFMPINIKTVRDFLEEASPIIKSCPDVKKIAQYLQDWVGSQNLYEEGSEEIW